LITFAEGTNSDARICYTNCKPATNAETKAARAEMWREVESNRGQARLDRQEAEKIKREPPL
jgi:hypothetical protein